MAGPKLAIAAVVIVIAVMVSGVALYYHGDLGASHASSGTLRTDLCTAPGGDFCAGSVIMLPFVEEGRDVNVSLCESIVPNGTGDHVELSYLSSVPMFGVIVPSGLYWGTTVTFLYNPSGYFNNSTAMGEAAWNSGRVSGHQSLTIAIPTDVHEWCLAWWDPGPSGDVVLGSNATLTYQS